MNLGLVIEYLYRDGFKFSEEVYGLIDFMKAETENTYVINPLKTSVSNDFVLALNLSTMGEERVPIESFKSLFFGQMGQKFKQEKFSNALAENLPHLCSLFESLEAYQIPIINPVETIRWNVSKEYLLELETEGFSVTPSIKVNSVEDLIELNNSSTLYLAKPMIAERGNGILFLDGQPTDEVLANYFQRFNELLASDPSNMYEELMSHQGLLVQEYNPNFLTQGEIKIFVIDGEVTVARKVVLNNDFSTHSFHKIVAVGRDGVSKKHIPSDYEKELALSTFNKLNKSHPIRYLRLDIVPSNNSSSDPYNISEIELINPCSATVPYTKKYTEGELYFHNSKLLEMIRNP